MWQVVIPALVAAIAALAGVALGALVEPLKLRAARLARIRQDRSERSARLIETAMDCRARLLSLNLAHRRAAAGEPPSGASEEDRLESYRIARNEFRKTVALLRLSGPDELAVAAQAVKEAEDRLRALRFANDESSFDRDYPPQPVLDRLHELEQTVLAFASIARRYLH